MSGETTPDRILATALRLFNRHGLDRVPVYKIAAELGISPGNLTYHFARKQDILYALMDRLEAEASEVFASPRNPDAAELARYIVNLFRLMWRYHFFFASLTHLTATDANIVKSHQRLMSTAIRGSIQRIEDAVACGDIPAIVKPTSPRILGENMWAVWVNRLGIERPGADGEDGEIGAVYDCCVHHLSLIQPYASRHYIELLHKHVRDILGLDVSMVA